MGVKIYLTKRVAGPSGNWGPGSTIEVSETNAGFLVAAGAAELIAGMQPYVYEAEVKALAKKETSVEKAVVKREKATEG